MAEKCVLLIMDGVGDLPCPLKTPLQLAKAPNLCTLVRAGMLGMLAPIGRYRVPGSDTAHLAILGYAPEEFYPGRGPLEALGAGIALRAGDVALRANFATLAKGGREIRDRRAGRLDSASGKKLEKYANFKIGGVDFIFRATAEHRGVLVMRGTGLSAAISPTDPHGAGKLLVSKPTEKGAAAEKAAGALNLFTKEACRRLSAAPENAGRALPANAIILRGAGMMREVEPFHARFGIRGACVAGGALYKGVAKYIGMDVLHVSGATGDHNTDLHAKARAVRSALKTHDFVFLHIKATDSFAHDGDCEGKRAFIEKIDAQVVPALHASGAALIITGDHSTACPRKGHTGYEVPILVYEKGGRSDGSARFDESNAMKGGLGHIRGKDIIPLALNMIGKSKMFGT